ncbi:MAG: prolyl oligopeptidase family serine peptidase [Planctomycetota bacterium]
MAGEFPMNRFCAFSIAAALLVTPAAVRADDSPAYPKSPKVNHVDDYHGTKVTDPYRWLEHDVRESKKVEDWVKAQNRVTFAFLKQIPERQALEKRLTELWDFEKFRTIFKEGGRYYYRYNSGLQNQSVLMVMNSLDDEPEVLLDPTTWSEDGTVALAGMSFSDDGRYIAYGIQDGGSDWRTWKVMEIESRRVLDDDLKWLKFAARLQEAHAGDAPVLIRIETRAGHGSGKPTEMIIEEIADQWAFLVEALDIKTSRADE